MQRGAVAVEFALVLPILVTLVFGITSAGLSYTHAIGVTNAVREGSRFGATADTTSGTWATDVIARVRATQFDDSTDPAQSTTAVCAELYKVGTGASTIPGTFFCSNKTSNAPKAPTLGTSAAPSVSGIASGTCVARVWAARDFAIEIIVAPAWKGTAIRTSVARYERKTC